MKILHVIQTLSIRHGGPATTLRGLAHAQIRAGHEVSICTTNDNEYEWKQDTRPNCHIVENGINIWCYKAYFKPLLLSNKLAFWLRSEVSKYEIIHIHSLYRFPVTYAAWVARKKGIPYIISPHGSLDPFLFRQSHYNLGIKRLYERLFDIPNLNNAAAIHYTTLEEADRAAFLRLRAKPVVIPNGIDWERYRDLPAKGLFRKLVRLNSETLLVLFLGRINFKKGLDLLVPAFSQVLRELPEARLAIVGPDNEGYGTKVRRWCREQGVADKVLFVDHLSSDDVMTAYVDADVFVLPSYTENFGNTVVEAMACACPVVISDQVNIWREIKAVGAGIVVGLNCDQIANAICRILQNKEEAQLMGTRGRRAAKELYVWPDIIEKFTHVYEELIEEAAAKRPARN